MSHPTLIQFRSSHYNEKARWALDYKRIPHVRKTLLPGLHFGTVKKSTGQQQVPVLVRDGEAITDSTRIIAALEASHPEPRLYPQDPALRARALALEDYFDEELGAAARHAVFFCAMPHPAFVASIFAGNHPALVRHVYGLMLTMRRGQLVREMNLTPEAFDVSCKQIDAALTRLESEVGSRGYLAGDAFSVADLTAAALFSILVFPDEWPHPPLLERPRSVRELHARFANRRGIDWVREIYRKHRGESAAVKGR